MSKKKNQYVNECVRERVCEKESKINETVLFMFRFDIIIDYCFANYCDIRLKPKPKRYITSRTNNLQSTNTSIIPTFISLIRIFV